jgi:hypothetical protein
MEWTQDKCTQVLNNMTGTIHDQLGHTDINEVEFLVRQGVLLMHMYTRAVELSKVDTIQDCIHNMNAIDDHIHQHPEFIREYKNEMVSNEHSDSIYVHYAISLKRYKEFMEDEKEKLMAVIHSLAMVSPEEASLLLPDARKKINEYIHIKKDVCASVFRLFEYVVEYEQLQKLMHQTSPPSSVPLPVEVGEMPDPKSALSEVQSAPELSTPAQGPHLTPRPLEEEAPEPVEPVPILRQPDSIDDIPLTQDSASALPPPEPRVA